MKILFSIILSISSLLLFAQEDNKVEILTKQGAKLKCKVLSMDKDKIQIERPDGRTAIASAETIESINGMTYEDFFLSFKEGTTDVINFPLNEAGEIEYTEVVQVDGVNAKELFVRAKEWLALTFVSSESVIDFEDKEAGKIIGNGILEVYRKRDMGISMDLGINRFMMEIQVKDGRYKYKIYKIKHELMPPAVNSSPGNLLVSKPGGGIFTMGQKNWDYIKSESNRMFLDLIDSLKKQMAKPSDRSSDDW